ncbi:MAG: alpha/beta hydrolase, partial [Burkholderiales bacterium]
AIDVPADPARGLALIAHPHPLFGGTLDNKVVQTLARALIEQGCVALRPNFRGVGASEGSHDQGRGEVDDLAATLVWGQREFGRLPLALAGFSFGAAMQARFAQRAVPRRMLLVGVAVDSFEVPPVPEGTLVVHGERDQTVPLASVLDWARPQELPVFVVPGAEHFFHRKLQALRAIVRHHWCA